MSNERIPDVPGDAGYDPNEFKALATVLYKLPDCKECGTSPYCNDTCYEKTRVEDAEAQAIATEAATLKRVGEWLDNINLDDYDLEGLKYFIIASTRELKQGDFPT